MDSKGIEVALGCLCALHGQKWHNENDFGGTVGALFVRALRLTSSQPRERLDGTVYSDANELVNTNLFADFHKLFV